MDKTTRQNVVLALLTAADRIERLANASVSEKADTTADVWRSLSRNAKEMLRHLSRENEIDVETFEGFGFTLKDASQLEAQGLVTSLGVDGFMITRQGKNVFEDNKHTLSAGKESLHDRIANATASKAAWYAYQMGGLSKHWKGPFPSAAAAKKWAKSQGEGKFKPDGAGAWVGENYAVVFEEPPPGKKVLEATSILKSASVKASGSLHDRIAKALKWSLKEVNTLSLASLRDLVRPVDLKLADEITEVMDLGQHIKKASGQHRITITYSTYTPESVEHGDAADHGFVDEEGVSMEPDESDIEDGVTPVDLAVKFLKSEGASEPSNSAGGPRTWYSQVDPAHDRAFFEKGEETIQSYHLEGFSPEEEAQVFAQMTNRSVKADAEEPVQADEKVLLKTRILDGEPQTLAFFFREGKRLGREEVGSAEEAEEIARDWYDFGESFAVVEASRPSDSKATKVIAAALDPFERQYLETALWSSNDESDERGGNPLDKSYSVDDIAESSIQVAKKDCAQFREEAGELLDGLDEKQAGHDFWLTRNGHGAGFWDRGLGDVGEALTKLSKKFGEIDPVIGDDGLIYIE